MVRLLEAFRCPPGGAHVLGHCMGGAMFLRALSEAPALFGYVCSGFQPASLNLARA